ncbi:MAG: small subunit ribosomal protein S15 [Methanobacteriota archaeon]|jgi:small subunit ribosomal protein S15|uniref:Small ribosomal subunit protein uS15 n=1 Tax=Halorutilus salinus TaxID=2487751 RepID=A0A9Q4C6F0_9EURY|nr:30S ribosomal protein S15 [Halorutilus salinus]MCX2819947.1 30S ribosomal protein S15 [Halorutilus salinus]
MARMHTRRRGSSASDKPVTDEPPEWSADDADAVEERVVELAEQGLTAAEIGVELRDSGVKGEPVPDVKLVTGKKISEILEEEDAAPEYPDDLTALMEKALRLRDHVDEHNTDASNKRALQNVESKIRRLADYYRGDELPEGFSYSPETARRIVG